MMKYKLFGRLTSEFCVAISNVVVVACCLSAVGQNGMTEPKGECTNANSGSISPLPVDEAFRKVLSFMKGHLNLHEQSGAVSMQRGNLQEWLLTFKSFSGLPPEGLCVTVHDSGQITINHESTNRTACDWLPTVKNKKSRRLLPHVAFKKACEALKRYSDSDTFSSPKGRIAFFRDRKDECWVINVSGYPGMRLGGYWVSVHDDGEVKVLPLP